MESMAQKECIMTLVEMMFWKLELQRIFLNNRRLIKTVFLLKMFLLFKHWHPNLVCSKSGIQRT